MSGEDWWDTPSEIEASPGLPARRVPQEMDEVDKYRLPKVITVEWVTAQLTKSEWAQLKRTQKNLMLNPHVIVSMCKDAAKGLSKRSIMARHGMSVATWARWEHKAAEDIQPYALWYNAMMYTVSGVEEELLDNIKLAGQADWKASKWLLEQLNKDEYGPTPKNQITNINGDINTETSVNHVDDTAAMQIAKIMQSIGALDIPDEDIVEDAEVIEDGGDTD